MRTIGRDFGDTARKVYAVASGALGNGKAVIVNSDGTVSVPAAQLGSSVVFEQGTPSSLSAVYDPDVNRVVVAYSDEGDGEKGKAVIGTVSGTSISFGSIVTFANASTFVGSVVYDTNADRVVIAYLDNDNSSGSGTAIVGTISGTSVSFGSEAVFQSGQIGTVKAAFDSTSNKIVFAYSNTASDSEHGYAIVGTVSGTNISFGSSAEFENAQVKEIAAIYDPNANKTVIAYSDWGNSRYGTAIVATVSGTSISFGSAAIFESARITNTCGVFDPDTNKVVIAYTDTGNSSYGTVVVSTVSNTSISFGTPVVFESASTAQMEKIAYDTSANKVVIGYNDGGNSSYGTIIYGTVSGTSISFESPVVFLTENTMFINSIFDPDNDNLVLIYRDQGNSEYGTGVVYNSDGKPLTSENYIGITPSAYPDGAGAEIQTKGAVNEEQSGLTAGQSYFVQTDGTLGTTAGDPSVFAGTAVSATKIIVKG